MKTKQQLYNPLTNCKIVAANVEYEAYAKTDEKRGSPNFPMTSGALKHITHCPHRWFVGYEPKETESQKWGLSQDAHIAGTFEKKYVQCPDTYPCEQSKKDPRTEKPWTRQSQWCKDWEVAQEQIGKIALKSDEMNASVEAFAVLMSDPDIRALIECSAKQVMVVGEYHDEDTDLIVPVKGLIDLVPSIETPILRECLADFKTTATAAPFLWPRLVDRLGYDLQAAFYIDLYNEATGELRTNFLHAIQENYEPWEVGKRLLGEQFLNLGRMKYLHALKLYCRCLKTGVWPGYDNNDWILTVPEGWMEMRMLPALPALGEPPESGLPEDLDDVPA